ncbi:MAG: carboxypeptidase-like regulatory domain-containing protein [Pyrinomonadaceae bacterium]
MPRKATYRQNLKDDASVKSALISRKGTIIIAVIAAIGTVFAAFITKWPSKSSEQSQRTGTYKYVGRVLDQVTGRNIKAAKISLEGSGEVPAVAFTDSEGVFSFPVEDPKQEIHLRIEAAGYESFDLGVVPAGISGIQIIHLTPLPSPIPAQPVQTVSPPPGAQPPILKSTEDTNHNPGATAGRTEGTDRVSGIVIDAETGKPIAGARVNIDGYAGESVTTKADGTFNLAMHSAKGKMFWIRAEKEGYAPKEVVHQAGSQTATIRLSINNK